MELSLVRSLGLRVSNKNNEAITTGEIWNYEVESEFRVIDKVYCTTNGTLVNDDDDEFRGTHLLFPK